MLFSLVFIVSLVTTTSAQTVCGATSYYGPSGVISSPNYPGNYFDDLLCDYYIYSSDGGSLSFIFNSFSTEPSYDYVQINCPANTTFLQKSYYGQSLPIPLSVPWCSEGKVRFYTDDDDHAYSGFSLDYFVSVGGCGNTIYTATHGYVTSPSYPSYFGHNQNCTNIIWAAQPSHFHLQFLFIDLPACGLCTCDWVEISCLDNNPSDTQRFCGEIERSHDVYQCTRVLVWFRSDSANVYPGFNLEYSIDNDTETTSVSSTMESTQTVPQSTQVPPDITTIGPSTITPPTNVASTTDSKQSTPIPSDCGDTYYGPSGVISSPNYPGMYSNDLSCDYYVTASSSSSSIAIIFQAFDTEQCCDYVTISCPTNTSHPSVRYSGSSLPQPFSIPWCSKAAVNFITDSATVSTGFSLDYHISLGGCGDTVYSGSHGYVSSPNYPSNYGDNHNCSNIIYASLRSSFSLTFQYLNVEECCDFVELSCLDNAEYGSQRFTGTSIPPKQVIPQCTQVLVWFYSDATVGQPGFNLEYFVTPESG